MSSNHPFLVTSPICCTLYHAELPDDLKRFTHHYFLTKEGLKYIESDGKTKDITIAEKDFPLFIETFEKIKKMNQEIIKKVNQEDEEKIIPLTYEQVDELITEITGHVREFDVTPEEEDKTIDEMELNKYRGVIFEKLQELDQEFEPGFRKRQPRPIKQSHPVEKEKSWWESVLAWCGGGNKVEKISKEEAYKMKEDSSTKEHKT